MDWNIGGWQGHTNPDGNDSFAFGKIQLTDSFEGSCPPKLKTFSPQFVPIYLSTAKKNSHPNSSLTFGDFTCVSLSFVASQLSTVCDKGLKCSEIKKQIST